MCVVWLKRPISSAEFFHRALKGCLHFGRVSQWIEFCPFFVSLPIYGTIVGDDRVANVSSNLLEYLASVIRESRNRGEDGCESIPRWSHVCANWYMAVRFFIS